MTRDEPSLEVVVRLIEIAATHVLRDSKGVAWRIGGYSSENGLQLVNASKSFYVKRIDGFTVAKLCESPNAKKDSPTDLRVTDETQRSEG